jgi:hypothetical protein
MRKLFSQIVRNEETVYAESEDLRNYFGEFCTNQSSLHGETLFGDVNCCSISRERFDDNGFRSQHIGLANARFAKSPKTRHLAELNVSFCETTQLNVSFCKTTQ